MKYMIVLNLMLLSTACRLYSMEFGEDINAFILNIYPDQPYTIEGVRGKLPIKGNFFNILRNDTQIRSNNCFTFCQQLSLLDALRRKYQTTEIIRIKPGITQYKDFLVNRLPIH